MEGLEPTHLTALDPKSSASTNFATPAIFRILKDKNNIRNLTGKKKNNKPTIVTRAIFTFKIEK